VFAAIVAAVVFLATNWLSTEALPYFGLGVGAAVFAAMFALWLHGRFLDPRAAAPFASDGKLMASRLQSLLAAAFAVKPAVVVIGVLALRQSGVKFDDMAVFAVTFAVASLLSQLATAGFLAHALQRRSRPGTNSH
jgi:hypothetical protein